MSDPPTRTILRTSRATYAYSFAAATARLEDGRAGTASSVVRVRDAALRVLGASLLGDDRCLELGGSGLLGVGQRRGLVGATGAEGAVGATAPIGREDDR